MRKRYGRKGRTFSGKGAKRARRVRRANANRRLYRTPGKVGYRL